MNSSDNTNYAALFRNLTKLANFIDSSQDADEIYLLLTRGVCEHSKWDISSIQVLDADAALAVPIVRHDPFNNVDLSKFCGWDARLSPVGQVLKERQPLVITDAAAQDEFPGFRDDAHQRGFHTTVIVPLDVRDLDQRPMVYSVASREIVDVHESDLSFLQCVAELCAIAVRKMRNLEEERQQVLRMRSILKSMSASIDKTLDSESVGSLCSGLSSLFPSGWLAVDLTSGRGLFDPDAPPPFPLTNARRVPDSLISAAFEAGDLIRGASREISIGGSNIRTEVSALKVDGSHVGALFFFQDVELSDYERMAAQAGRLALSAFIMRSFVEFKSRRVTTRRLLGRIFARDLRDYDDLLDEAHQLDFDLTKATRLLVLRLPKGSPFDDGTHSFILSRAQSVFGKAISCTLDGELVLLIADPDGTAEQGQSNFFKRIRPFLPCPTIFVMSGPVVGPEPLQRAYETCENTLDLAQAMQISGWVTPVEVGEFPALMASAEQTQVQAYLNNVLPEGLVGGGRKTKVALETIEVFLQTGRRYQEAANQLRIHVSTLRYRLEQLSDLYSINFNDPDRCFELELAIRLIKFKKSYDKQEN